MDLHLMFRSRSFPPVEGEDALLINEGTHGKALIEWLAVELEQRGVHVNERIVEDFGWFAYFRRGQISGGLACTIHQEGAWHECHVSIDAKVSMRERLFNRSEAKRSLSALEFEFTSIVRTHPDVHDLVVETISA